MYCKKTTTNKVLCFNKILFCAIDKVKKNNELIFK